MVNITQTNYKDLLTLLFYKGGEKTEMAVAGVQTTLDIILVYREGGKIKSVIFIFDTLHLSSQKYVICFLYKPVVLFPQ